MKVNRKILFGLLLMLASSTVAAEPELEEIVLYSMITLAPHEVVQSIQDEETKTTIRLHARKVTPSNRLELLKMTYGTQSEIRVPLKLMDCIPRPQLQLIRIITTSDPMHEYQFQTRGFYIYVPFSGYWTQDEPSAFTQPELTFAYHGAKLTEITVRNGKGDFVKVDGPTNTCPMKEIEWALEGAH